MSLSVRELKKSGFEIEGLENLHFPAISVVKLLDFLKNLPDGKILTSKKLSERSGVEQRVIADRRAKDEALTGYYYQIHKTFLWGNPNSIKQFKEYYERESSKIL